MKKILVNDGIHPRGKELLEQAGFEVDTNTIPQDELMSKLNALRRYLGAKCDQGACRSHRCLPEP